MAPPGWPSTARTWSELALELAAHDSSYEEMALKFLGHFLWIASVMNRIGDNQDEM
jgi:hypothetical protein